MQRSNNSAPLDFAKDGDVDIKTTKPAMSLAVEEKTLTEIPLVACFDMLHTICNIKCNCQFDI